MKNINNIKIGTRQNLLLGASIVIMLSILGTYIYKTQSAQIIEQTDLRISEQVNDMGNLIQNQVKERQTQIKVSIEAAEELLKNKGSFSLSVEKISINATDQISKETKQVEIPELIIGGTSIYNSTQIVDEITSITNAKATIFQKIDGGYLRISTTVTKEDGSRAVGTYISNSSPVVQAIDNGEAYVGRAFVVNDWYLSAYHPIKVNGSIEGILFVGVPEKDMKGLKAFFSSKKYLETGYPFLVDNKGTLVIHPNKEGENFKDAEFFKQLEALTADSGKTFYPWEGR